MEPSSSRRRRSTGMREPMLRRRTDQERLEYMESAAAQRLEQLGGIRGI